MREVKAPPVMSDIQLFAKAYFNLELTTWQLQYIEALSTGRTLRGGKAMGITTATNVLKAYVAEGLKPGGRVRLPMHPLPPKPEKMKGATQEGKILALIQRPGGAYNFELSRYALKYTSAISSLRKDGHDIVADRQYLKNGRASNTWRYRIGGQ